MRMTQILMSIVVFLAMSGSATAQDSMSEIVDAWAKSAHADAKAEAFTHWNDEEAVPPQCAICHAGTGFRSYYGLDGSLAGQISEPVATGGVIDCDTCHTKGASEITQVLFPSGITLEAMVSNGTCFTCHQGRQSGAGIAKAIDGLDSDTVDPNITFLNPHYAAAAATLMGSEAGGAYEYPGKNYRMRFAHVPTASTCTDCHSPHSLSVRTDTCVGCHKTDVAADIRTSPLDYDADGDITEGVAGEIATLHTQLGDAIISYAKEKSGADLIYAPSAYPYFFNDINANGALDDGEAVYPNRYTSWTPRLLIAAYNFQFVAKDPGSYAHNPNYTLQILYDSIEDLTGKPAVGAQRPQ